MQRHAAQPNGMPLSAAGAGQSTSHRAAVRTLAALAMAAALVAGCTPPLCREIADGHVARAREMILQGESVNAADPDGRTPLMHAAKAGYDDLVDLLLEKGASPTARCRGGETVLMAAARCTGINLRLMRRLIAEGADVQGVDDRGNTALMRAARAGVEANVRLLTASGAHAGRADNKGVTPLMVSPDAATATALLDAGADVNARDDRGRSALHYAAGGGREDVARLLVRHGAAVNAADKDAVTPLHEAVRRVCDQHRALPVFFGDGSGGYAAAVVEWLLRHGAQPRWIDKTAHDCYASAVGFLMAAEREAALGRREQAAAHYETAAGHFRMAKKRLEGEAGSLAAQQVGVVILHAIAEGAIRGGIAAALARNGYYPSGIHYGRTAVAAAGWGVGSDILPPPDTSALKARERRCRYLAQRSETYAETCAAQCRNLGA